MMLELILGFVLGSIVSAIISWQRNNRRSDGELHVVFCEDGAVIGQSLQISLSPKELAKRRRFSIDIIASHEKQGAI